MHRYHWDQIKYKLSCFKVHDLISKAARINIYKHVNVIVFKWGMQSKVTKEVAGFQVSFN